MEEVERRPICDSFLGFRVGACVCGEGDGAGKACHGISVEKAEGQPTSDNLSFPFLNLFYLSAFAFIKAGPCMEKDMQKFPRAAF